MKAWSKLVVEPDEHAGVFTEVHALLAAVT